MAAEVLLVDDDVLQANTRNLILTRAGFSVTVAATAIEALAKLEGADSYKAFGLVITDHLMPGMNGPEFVTRLRQIAPFLPVVVLSGEAEADCLYDDLDVHFRVKPFPPAELISLARSLLITPESLTA